MPATAPIVVFAKIEPSIPVSESVPRLFFRYSAIPSQIMLKATNEKTTPVAMSSQTDLVEREKKRREKITVDSRPEMITGRIGRKSICPSLKCFKLPLTVAKKTATIHVPAA
jgi:hypothetical protein